jgi:hypothetical protein
MLNLRLNEEEVKTERDVILAERRSKRRWQPAQPAQRSNALRALPQPTPTGAPRWLGARDGEIVAPGRQHVLTSATTRPHNAIWWSPVTFTARR